MKPVGAADAGRMDVYLTAGSGLVVLDSHRLFSAVQFKVRLFEGQLFF